MKLKYHINMVLFLNIIAFPNFILIKEKVIETQVLTVYSRIRRLSENSSYILNNNQSNVNNNFKNKLEWPEGSYGMLQPSSGCPNTKSIQWKTGWLFQNTENDKNENNSSSSLHTSIKITKFGITQKFCIKDSVEGPPWPKGTFCIYQYGLECPYNFHSGYVYWDDENTNNKNSHEGYLPQGSYGQDTEIRFCCRWDGDLEKDIELPTENPFCLFPKNVPKCQNVKNMNHILEYVKFDDEDDTNMNNQGGSYPYGIQPSKRDNFLYYCYYFKKDNIFDNQISDYQTLFESSKKPEGIKLKVRLSIISKAVSENGQPINLKKSISVFFAIAIVTMIFGFTLIISIKSAIAIGLKNLRVKKEKSVHRDIDSIKVQVNKKYGTIQNSKQNYPKEGIFTKQWDCEEFQELTEDYLVPKNSELQHSLALLFMKNQKK